MARIRWAALALISIAAAPLKAQSDQRDSGTITIVIGAEPTLPIPTLSPAKQNVDVGSLLFLHLARMGKRLSTTDERDFEPELARSWSRRDSLTLAFDLDTRVHWHDGQPVTARDIVWSVNRVRDSATSPTYSLLLRDIASVTSEGPSRVVFKYRRAYAEQMYDAVWQVAPLPAHLLEHVPSASLATSSFATHPVGNGPYRYSRLEPGRLLELVANPDFFLGRPKLERVIFLVVRGAEAQLNLMLDGTADAYEAPMLARQVTPVIAKPDLKIQTMPSFSFAYLLFNQKAYGVRSKPHPILADPAVRRAITLAIDRQSLLRSTFGPYASLVDGPMGLASWIRRLTPKLPGYDRARAKTILAERGWTDRDGDGVLEKDGQALVLRLNYPGTNLPRVTLAEPVQQMLRQVGIRVDLVRLDGPIWAERRTKGEFDIDFSQTTLDPSPSGLVQSWSCAGIGGSNVASTCNPAFDRALARATATVGDAGPAWRDAIRALQDGTPAMFFYSPMAVIVTHARYRNVSFRPEAVWSDLWRWSVAPGRRIARDER